MTLRLPSTLVLRRRKMCYIPQMNIRRRVEEERLEPTWNCWWASGTTRDMVGDGKVTWKRVKEVSLNGTHRGSSKLERPHPATNPIQSVQTSTLTSSHPPSSLHTRDRDSTYSPIVLTACVVVDCWGTSTGISTPAPGMCRTSFHISRTLRI